VKILQTTDFLFNIAFSFNSISDSLRLGKAKKSLVFQLLRITHFMQTLRGHFTGKNADENAKRLEAN